MAKVLISMDDALLRQVDRAAKGRGVSRSGFIAELAAREVDCGPGARAEVQSALGRLQSIARLRLVDDDAVSAVRAERAARDARW